MKKIAKNSSSFDVVSIVMTVLFVLLVAGGIAFMFFNPFDNDAEGQEATEANLVEPEEAEQYETYQELFNKFVEACNTGDIETLYSLYYNDMLTSRCENSGVPKNEYDSNLRSYMIALEDFEEYPYGEDVLLSSQSPLGYINELHYKAYGESFPYNDVTVNDCVAVRGYLTNGATMDFMLAQIDGCWYMAV